MKSPMPSKIKLKTESGIKGRHEFMKNMYCIPFLTHCILLGCLSVNKDFYIMLVRCPVQDTKFSHFLCKNHKKKTFLAISVILTAKLMINCNGESGLVLQIR